MLRGIWGWAKIAPMKGQADALGQFEKVQTSRLWPSSKKTRTHTESRNPRRGRTRPLNGPRCCLQTWRADRRARKALGYSAPPCTACLPLKFLLILIIADHRGRSGTLCEMKALKTKRVHKKIFKSFPFPLSGTIPCLTDL